jgi:VWFA-related protein
MRTRLLAPTTVALAVAATMAQQPQVPGTFRSTATLVPVDVRVIDRDGRPITDLEQKDFTIFEDGVAQPIRQFAAYTIVAGTPEPLARITPATAARIEPAPARHRTFLIVLGRGRLQHPSRGVDASIRFVRDQLLPQDQVAILAYNRASHFTADHAAVVRLLESFGRRHESIEAKLAHRFSGLSGVYGGRKIPDHIKTEIDEMFAAADGPGFRTVPPGRVTESGRIADDVQRTTQQVLVGDVVNSNQPVPRDSVTPPSMADLSLDDYISSTARTMTDLENLYTGIEFLRYLEGEKHLVFVTENGLFLPRVEDDGNIAAMANDARVVLHTIHTGGVSAGTPIPGANGLRGADFNQMFSIQALRLMSELTGGQASAHEYAEKAFTRIDATTRSQYLVGYAPSNSASDGRYRRIEVRVNRPGATVLSRRGYYARPQLVPYDRREFLTYSRMSAAALYHDQIRDIKVRLKTSFERPREGRGGEVVFEVTIDLTPIMMRARRTDPAGPALSETTLDLAMLCHDNDGNSVGEQWKKVEISLTEEEYKQALRTGYKVAFRLPVRSGPTTAKVIVYDYTGDLLGTTDQRVN